MKRYLVLLVVTIAAISCYRPVPYYPPDVAGYKAVYSNDPQLKFIKFTSSKPMSYPGKIYVKDNLILQNDMGSGIHVLDASNPSHLEKRGFISIPGNLELSIKGKYLYANSYADLVVIDIRNLDDLREVRRVYNAFNGLTTTPWSGSYIPMPEKNAYYECVNPGKGIHIGWEKDTLKNECYFYNF